MVSSIADADGAGIAYQNPADLKVSSLFSVNIPVTIRPTAVRETSRANKQPRATADAEAAIEDAAALRAAVKRGIGDADAGRLVDVDEAFDRVDAMLDQMEAAHRHPGRDAG